MDVLIIESDDRRAIDIGDYLSSRGDDPDFASDGALAIRLCDAHRYDAVILDPDPPRVDGDGLCTRLRAGLGSGPPIIVLSGNGRAPRAPIENIENCVLASNELPDLYARLESAVHYKRRRLKSVGSAALQLDPDLGVAHCAGETVPLAPTSYRILELLVQAHPDIVLRETIENAVWPECRPASEAALRGHVHRLRQLLAEVGGESLIRTVRGVGYRLSDAV
ncbi:response regulator transcription factor [Salinisphaera sp.]|uniref:response regulator transcription factor n=1 Tax=Salinisphaera sp. TaxID=1914330 RepID=UPI000C5D3D99|nr:response regulator transcription factor [Salinisphaera sp.]MBS62672.1 two-component system response regulator [Salinisphaera sp.]